MASSPRAADEDREACEQRLLRLVEHVVAPGDRAAQRLLPFGKVAGAAGEQSKAVLEPAQHRFGREDPDARRRQLDGQRQPIEAHADLGHRRRVVVRDVEIGLHGARSLDEERDCLELRELREWRQVGGIGEAERRNRILLLAGDVEDAAAAGQDGEVRAGSKEGVDRRRRVGHLLEVVEDEQHAPLADVVDQPIDRAAPATLGKAERLADGGRYELRLGDGRQLDEEDALREGAQASGPPPRG